MKTVRHIGLFTILMIFLFCSLSVAAQKSLMMATTTSTDNTGLLDYLAPLFTKDTGIDLKWTAVGTGKALKLGENCDVDVLLVHAPPAEKKYIKNGYGKSRREIMFNDFVIIGPANDPAHIKGKGVIDALKTIAGKKVTFVSRGDDSGTNKMEKRLWTSTHQPVPERQSWYVQTGQGMLSTINVAAERSGYTLTDRGTYIKYEANMGGNPPLKIIVQGDKILRNQYSVVLLNTKRCPKIKEDLAVVFSNWMADPKTQNLIKNFKLLGKPLFVPNAK